MSGDQKYMVFVDGTNLLAELSRYAGGAIRAEKPTPEDFELALKAARKLTKGIPDMYRHVRSHWFGSFMGDEPYRSAQVETLRRYRFEAHLFQRRNKREKGVDIALTKEMLINAFNDNYDLALLIAGDEDYVGLVNELKRFGVIVYGSFLENGLSEAIRIAFDAFVGEAAFSSPEDRTFWNQIQKRGEAR